MKNIPTPRTTKLRAESIGFYSCATVPADVCAEIEIEAAQLRADNERLRAALAEVLYTCDEGVIHRSEPGKPQWNWSAFEHLEKIARAALLGKGDA